MFTPMSKKKGAVMNKEIEKLKEKTYKKPGILFNWDGDDGVRWLSWPATPGKLISSAIEQYVGTCVDTIIWCSGDGISQVNYGSKEAFVLDHDEYKDKYKINSTAWLTADNAKRLREKGGEIKILSEAAKKYGLKFYLGTRMNDTHDWIMDMLMAFKEEHSDWLIGKKNPEAKTFENWEDCTGFDYGVEEFRNYFLRIVKEFTHDYDIDGYQLDFCTWPPFFKRDERQKSIPVMTQFIRDIRKILDESALKKGHYIALNVQIAERPEDNLKNGLDIETWAKEGLIDEIIGGRSESRYYPLKEMIEIGHRYGVYVYGSLNHPLELTQMRGWAMTHWGSGADGLNVFNFYDYIKGNPDCEYGEFYIYDYNKGNHNQFLYEIGYPEKLKYLNKEYKVVAGPDSGTGSEKDDLRMSGAYPGKQLPVRMREGDKATIYVNCYDNTVQASEQNIIKGARLIFKMNNLVPVDEFKVTINGNDTERTYINRKVNNYKGVISDIDPEQIKYGENKVQISLTKRMPGLKDDLRIEDFSLELTYK